MYINCRGVIMSNLIILKSIKEMQHEKAKKETKVIISNIEYLWCSNWKIENKLCDNQSKLTEVIKIGEKSNNWASSIKYCYGLVFWLCRFSLGFRRMKLVSSIPFRFQFPPYHPQIEMYSRHWRKLSPMLKN